MPTAADGSGDTRKVRPVGSLIKFRTCPAPTASHDPRSAGSMSSTWNATPAPSEALRTGSSRSRTKQTGQVVGTAPSVELTGRPIGCEATVGTAHTVLLRFTLCSFDSSCPACRVSATRDVGGSAHPGPLVGFCGAAPSELLRGSALTDFSANFSAIDRDPPMEALPALHEHRRPMAQRELPRFRRVDHATSPRWSTCSSSRTGAARSAPTHRRDLPARSLIAQIHSAIGQCSPAALYHPGDGCLIRVTATCSLCG
jgi:hypothetical protein